MKKILLILLCVPLLFISCKKDNIDNPDPCPQLTFGASSLNNTSHVTFHLTGDDISGGFVSTNSLQSSIYGHTYDLTNNPFNLQANWTNPDTFLHQNRRF